MWHSSSTGTTPVMLFECWTSRDACKAGTTACSRVASRCSGPRAGPARRAAGGPFARDRLARPRRPRRTRLRSPTFCLSGADRRSARRGVGIVRGAQVAAGPGLGSATSRRSRPRPTRPKGRHESSSVSRPLPLHPGNRSAGSTMMPSTGTAPTATTRRSSSCGRPTTGGPTASTTPRRPLTCSTTNCCRSIENSSPPTAPGCSSNTFPTWPAHSPTRSPVSNSHRRANRLSAIGTSAQSELGHSGTPGPSGVSTGTQASSTSAALLRSNTSG